VLALSLSSVSLLLATGGGPSGGSGEVSRGEGPIGRGHEAEARQQCGAVRAAHAERQAGRGAGEKGAGTRPLRAGGIIDIECLLGLLVFARMRVLIVSVSTGRS
jgi:hypothetical protein